MNEEIKAGLEPEKPRGHIRGIWAITIIVIIAILVGGGVWYFFYKTTVQDQTTTNTAKISLSASPTASGSASTLPSTSGTDDTANWKSYSNSTYGFSVKYPAKSSVNEDTPKQGEIKWMVTFRDTTGCGNDAQCSNTAFTVEVYDNPNKLNAEQWIEAKFSSPAELRDSLMTSGVTVDGARGKRISSTFGDAGFQNVIVQSLTKPTIMFVITLDGNSASLENLFSQFINSFKFL